MAAGYWEESQDHGWSLHLPPLLAFTDFLFPLLAMFSSLSINAHNARHFYSYSSRPFLGYSGNIEEGEISDRVGHFGLGNRRAERETDSSQPETQRDREGEV